MGIDRRNVARSTALPLGPAPFALWALAATTALVLAAALEAQGRGAAAQVADVLQRQIEERPRLWRYDSARILAHLGEVKLVARGLTGAQIGVQLGIRPKTVESHRAHVAENLGIHDVADLVRFAIRVGLVDVES